MSTLEVTPPPLPAQTILLFFLEVERYVKKFMDICFTNFIINSLPPERIELSTPGLQDQCSATEL